MPAARLVDPKNADTIKVEFRTPYKDLVAAANFFSFSTMEVSLKITHSSHQKYSPIIR
jgi:hypothetical protein